MISIIMPTYNRFEIAKETIEKIAALSKTIPFELIVVNDGEAFPFELNYPDVFIFKNPKKGASAARNFGASKAKYNLLFFIDDDMWITNESLIAIKELSDDGFFTANCTVLNWKYPDKLITEMSEDKIGRYLLNANYHKMEGRLNQKIDPAVRYLKINSIGSGSFVISSQVFSSIGKYNEGFVFQGEDIDLSDKLNSANIGIFLYTAITCFHNQKDRLNINEFLDRDYRGYLSQFKRKDIKNIKPDKVKQFIFTLLIPLKFVFLFLFSSIPNRTIFDVIIFRIIGILSSISYFKAMKDAGKA